MLQALLEITKGVLTIVAYAATLSSCAKPTKTIAGEKPASKKSESSSKGSSSKGSSSRHESSSDSKASDSKSSMSKYKTPTKKHEVQTGQDELVLSVVKPAPIDYSQVPADVVEKLNQAKPQEEKEKVENWLPLLKTQSLAVEPKSAKPASKPRYQKKTHIVTVLAGEKRPTVLSAQPATPEAAASKPTTPVETPQPSAKEKGKPPPAPAPATPQPPQTMPPKPPSATPAQPTTPAKTPPASPAAPAGATPAKPSPYQPLATGKPTPPAAKPSPYQSLVTGKPATPTSVSPYQPLVTGKPAAPTQPAAAGQTQPPKPPGAPGQPSGKPDKDKTNSQSTPLLV